MRRAVLAITGLAASTAALVVLKGSPGASQVAQDLPADQASVAPGASGPAPGVTPTPGSASGPAPSVPPSAGASRTPGTKKTDTTARATTAAPRTTTTAPRPSTRTVTGPSVTYKYGSLQVRITLSGTRIVDATAVGMPVGGQSGLRSDDVQARYSGTSGEVVAKQSANLDTVSGATYTSTAYRQSLQAAIDKA
ncbi:FMN-binding protein [Micromonospora inositola]|uniref:FMN-binding domain-containing protein n=1 Tax=Micromonospora inositola TaxID=47865 RepID=A0A1C5ITT8_9ACTN|nr:FMN-binding protein [Micromonospora inositola]SCG61732.1 FMN-binding domain-containing protein [Micromonospora inositola]